MSFAGENVIHFDRYHDRTFTELSEELCVHVCSYACVCRRPHTSVRMWRSKVDLSLCLSAWLLETMSVSLTESRTQHSARLPGQPALGTFPPPRSLCWCAPLRSNMHGECFPNGALSLQLLPNSLAQEKAHLDLVGLYDYCGRSESTGDLTQSEALCLTSPGKPFAPLSQEYRVLAVTSSKVGFRER